MGTFTRQNFSDQLSIETPEGVALRFPVAGMGSRAIAVFVDHLIQGVAYVIIGFGLNFVGSARDGSGHTNSKWDNWFAAGVIFFLFCIWWGYFALFEAFWRGQTPGKRLMKLRVIKDAGRQITLFEAVARNVMRAIDLMPLFYMVGVITMACNKRNKRLGDLTAGTIVVHEGRDEQPMVVGGNALFAPAQNPAETWTAPITQSPATASDLFPADALARLGPDDLLVIDTFFARMLDLPMDTRETMANRIVSNMCAKMGVPVPPGNPERVLEAMLTGLRSGARRF